MIKKTNRLRRPWLPALLAAGLLLGTAAGSTPAHASAMEVDVQLPSFAVKLDGTAVDSSRLRYPLIVFHGVTYFPMTWEVSQATGLQLQWSPEEGLRVDPGGTPAGPLQMEQGSSLNLPGQDYAAYVASFPVEVDGKLMDLATEPYPPLLFRNITYIPMTWEFAVEHFGWTTGWDDRSGFSIQTGG